MAARYSGAGASSAAPRDNGDAGSFSGSEGSFSGRSGEEYDSGLEGDFDDGEDGADRGTPGGGVIVRQNSSFGKLSADSWLTVVSEYEKDGPNENLLFSQVEDEPQQSPEEQAAAQEMHAASAVAGASVLDAVVRFLLLSPRASSFRYFPPIVYALFLMEPILSPRSQYVPDDMTVFLGASVFFSMSDSDFVRPMDG